MLVDETLVTDLISFIERLRSELKIEIRLGLQNDHREKKDVYYWYIALGTLAWDISSALILLVREGKLRAATILVRCLFEYQIRLRYYIMNPKIAEATIKQIPTRFDKMASVFKELTPKALDKLQLEELDQYISKGAKLEREVFRTMLSTVMSETFARRHSGFYLDRQSGYVHGYETIFLDIMQEFGLKKPGAEPVWIPQIGREWVSAFSPEWTLAKAIEALLAMINAIREARSLAILEELDAEWLTLADKLPKPIW